MIDPAMYIFINEELGMSRGKIAAQAAHAAVEAFRLTPDDSNILRLWYQGGHYKKLVLSARNGVHLQVIERYLNDRGFKTVLIIDEGMTEIEAHQATALGVEVVDKNEPHTKASFCAFKLLRDPLSSSKPKPSKPKPDGSRDTRVRRWPWKS